MRRQIILILTDATTLDIKTGEPEHLLLEDTEILVAQLRQEQLLRKARITRIFRFILDGGHPAVELFTRDIQGFTQIKGIQMILRLIHHHHDVVGRLVKHQQLAVSVGDITTRRKVHLLQKGIRVGTLLIVVTGNLEGEETDDIDHHDDDGHRGNNKLPLSKIVFFLHFARTLSIAIIRANVRSELAPAHANQYCQLKKLKASKAKNARQ